MGTQDRALSLTELQQLLQDIQDASIGVLGDFGLDVYWFLDHSRSEPAPETGLDTHPIAEQCVSLAAAANVAHNLTALGCREVSAYAVIGDDLWGNELRRQLDEIHVDTSGMIVQPESWSTIVYIKPHIEARESNRFDLGNFNELAESAGSLLLANVEAALERHQVILINQQVLQGLHTPAFREKLNALIARRQDRVFVADCRHEGISYPGAYLKLNEYEAAVRTGLKKRVTASVHREETSGGAAQWDDVPEEAARGAAERLFERNHQPVFVTRGAHGCLVRNGSGISQTHAVPAEGQIDTVGAGDSTLAGIGAALAVGRDPVTAAAFGNLVASVTIRKLHCTGTATPEEILKIYRG